MRKYFFGLLFFVLLPAQDAAGLYKLSGVDVLYTYVTRDSVPLTVTDAYGFGITQSVTVIPAAVPFTTQAMQLNAATLPLVGINLNITLNEDGTGSVAEGSFYPDVNTVKDENGACVTLQQVLPVSDNFTYESSGSMMADAGIAHPGVNVLGLPGISTRAGTQMGGFGLAGSFTFEDFSATPIHPTICDAAGNCFPFTVGDLDSSGVVEVAPAVNALGIPEYVPGGVELAGLSGGYFLKKGLNVDSLSSVFPDNTQPDFILEWHGVDGLDSGLGYADDEEIDEDEDGTWFDRTLGTPGITATYLNPSQECGGYEYPIYGDLTETYTAMGIESCIDRVETAAAGYLMDPSGSLATWGNFLTAKAALYQMCQAYVAQGAVDAETCNGYLVDDSADNMDATCLDDYVPGNFETLNDCSGKLAMMFDVPCIPVIEAREVVAEFVSLGETSGCMESNACNYDPQATVSGYTCIYGASDVVDVDGNPTGSLLPCYIEGECDYGCNVLENDELIMPTQYSIDSVYPNPFNPNTNITFTIPISDNLEIKVYDLSGREIDLLKDGYTLAGTHSISWDASSYPSGIYIIKMVTSRITKTHKIVLAK